MNTKISHVAVLLGIVGLMALHCIAPLATGATLPADPAVALKAEGFPLSDVRLLDGPCKTAMERDAEYMLKLDPDRLLHNFRRNAKLPSSARPLGGWEAPSVELRGHLTGHYLSACALMYAASGDERFKSRAELLVHELAKCQSALGKSGYLSAFPETFLDRVETTGRVWAPYYTLHKILAGLLDAYRLCGIAEARDTAVRMGDWVVTRIGRLSDDQVEKMLSVEHGGINESMADLYALTGEQRYLKAARRLWHHSVLDPLANREDHLAGLHANTQFPKVIGSARLYELTGEDRYRTVADYFWDRVANHHSYVTGGNSDREHFGPADKLNARITPFTAETCNTYNMLKLTHHVFTYDASAAEADFCERALYNHILPSQDPETGQTAYHIPVYGGWFMPYNTLDNSAWCCTGTGFENHARYGESIYFQDKEGLFVNLFIASQLNWRAKDATLRQETGYPEEDTTKLTWHCKQPFAANVRIRYPSWAQQGMEIKVNGETVKHDGQPGSFVAVSRDWKDGDRIDVKIPMTLQLVAMPDNPSRAAICYGPVVLAGELGREGIQPPMPYARGQGDFFSRRPPPMPVLVTGGRPVGDWVEAVPGKPLAFHTKGVGQPKDVSLVAFYKLTPQRYSLYWDFLTPEEWKQRQASAGAQ